MIFVYGCGLYICFRLFSFLTGCLLMLCILTQILHLPVDRSVLFIQLLIQGNEKMHTMLDLMHAVTTFLTSVWIVSVAAAHVFMPAWRSKIPYDRRNGVGHKQNIAHLSEERRYSMDKDRSIKKPKHIDYDHERACKCIMEDCVGDNPNFQINCVCIYIKSRERWLIMLSTTLQRTIHSGHRQYVELVSQ